MSTDNMTIDDRIAAMLANERRLMAEQGWYIHRVRGNAGLINHHTHGVVESLGCLDFQIMLSMDLASAYCIFANLIKQVKAGADFAFGDYVAGITIDERWLVKLVTAKEHGRFVFRVVLPDYQGRIEEMDMDPQFRFQYNEFLEVE